MRNSTLIVIASPAAALAFGAGRAQAADLSPAKPEAGAASLGDQGAGAYFGPATGNVSLYNGTCQDIATARNAIAGEPAKRTGSTTGLRSGTVQTVSYQ